VTIESLGPDLPARDRTALVRLLQDAVDSGASVGFLPPLGEAEVGRRLRQFEGRYVVELTRAPTFREKARRFPGATFVVGMDTAERIAQPRYYGNRETMRAALDEIGAHGCRFLVAGRVDGAGRFATVAEVPIPAEYRALFSSIPEAQFRSDLSSTLLRRGRSAHDVFEFPDGGAGPEGGR